MISPEAVRDRALAIMETSGKPWHAAARRAAEELRETDSSWLVGSGAGNWLWFAPLLSNGTAVDLAGGAGDTAAALLSFFADVVYIEADPRWLQFARLRFPSTGPRQPRILPGGIERLTEVCSPVACISIAFPVSVPDEAAIRSLRQCHAALTPGGCLRVVPSWEDLQDSLLSLAWRRLISLTAWRHALRTAGFRAVKGYYVDPNHSDPRLIIPMWLPAVRTVERHNLRSSASSTARRLLARCNLHWPLYPQCFFLVER